MAVPTYDDDTLQLHLKKLDASLRCVLDHCKVQLNDQAHLGQSGFTSLRRVSAIYGDDAATARVGVENLGWNTSGLSGEPKLMMLVRIADIIAAFKEAIIHADREAKERADTISSEVPKPLKVAQLQELKTAYESKHGKMDKHEVPSRWFQAQKSDQVADNTPMVEYLADVTSKEDGEDSGFMPDLSSDGKVTIRKGPMKKVQLPKDPEELRNRHRLICDAWLMADIRHHSRTWLQGLTPRVWEKYTDYLVGTKVHKLAGAVVTWENVLHYDFELRQLAYETITDNNTITIAEALVSAVKNIEARQIHFIEKLTLNSRRSGNNQAWGSHQKSDTPNHNAMENGRRQDRPKGQGNQIGQKEKPGKGKNKGKPKDKKGKGKGAKGMKPKVNRTPDGHPICFKYNNSEGGCDGSCGMLHACQYCLKEECAAHKCKVAKS